jgi:hypothetical protein
MDTVSISKGESINPTAFIDEPIQAFRIFDEPYPVLPANSGVQTRDALRWYLHVVA